MKTFRGTYTVMITPFTPSGEVDVEALRAFVDWQIAQGIHGLIPLGSTGEFLSLDDDEKALVAETVISQAAGRVPVLIGTGAEDTREVVRLSRRAEKLGADGVMIIPPFYSTPTDDELVHHYKTVADAIALPIMVYNNPATANVDLKPAAGGAPRRDRQLPLHQGIDAGGDAGARHHPAVRRPDDRVRRHPRLRIIRRRRAGLGRRRLQRRAGRRWRASSVSLPTRARSMRRASSIWNSCR